jgi:hypothetical protein
LGTERREGEQGGVLWRMVKLSLYIGAEGGGQRLVIKMEKWLALMGMKWLTFKWGLIHGMNRGGGGNGRWMQCGARGSGSMAGEAGAAWGGGERPVAAVPALFSTGREKKAGWAGWAKKAGKAARPTRPKSKKKIFSG